MVAVGEGDCSLRESPPPLGARVPFELFVCNELTHVTSPFEHWYLHELSRMVLLVWLPSPPNSMQVELAWNLGERGWGRGGRIGMLCVGDSLAISVIRSSALKIRAIGFRWLPVLRRRTKSSRYLISILPSVSPLTPDPSPHFAMQAPLAWQNRERGARVQNDALQRV